MGIEPIKSTRIYEEIVRQIKGMIGEGRLKSGDQLPPERDLAEKFIVSRTSVREALRALESVGLIEIRPGEGTFVREVSVDALVEPLALVLVSQREMIGELFEARRLLEPAIAGLAARRARDEARRGAALIRELHTYGPHLPLHTRDDQAAQHRGFGRALVAEAERIAQEEFSMARMAVIAGVGVREYYRKFGYELQETYMVKSLWSNHEEITKHQIPSSK
jgi:DNA-binding FadR family transcriptional regulator